MELNKIKDIIEVACEKLDLHSYYLQIIKPFTVYGFNVLEAFYTLGTHFNQRLNLCDRPRQIKIVMYTILGLFGIGTWAFLKDFNQVACDANVDKKLCEMGPEFIAAGVTYCEKTLKRNIALRNLLGNDKGK